MTKTHHRLRKHDMKEDSFVTFAFRAQEYVQTHQKSFMIGLGALIVVTAGIWFWGSAGHRAETAAEQGLGDAFLRVQQNDMAGAAAAYRRVIDEHRGTAGAREALFYLANLYFVQQDWPAAIDTYREYIDRYADWDQGREAAAWAAIGDAHQAEGSHGDALSAYRKALGVEGTDYLAPDILLGAARSAVALDDRTQAVEFADLLFNLAGNSPDMVRMRELLAGHGIVYARGL